MKLGDPDVELWVVPGGQYETTSVLYTTNNQLILFPNEVIRVHDVENDVIRFQVIKVDPQRRDDAELDVVHLVHMGSLRIFRMDSKIVQRYFRYETGVNTLRSVL